MRAVAALVLAVGVLGARAPSGRPPVELQRRLQLVLRLAGAVLLVGAGAFSAMRASPASAASKASGLAILYSSSWDGLPEIFAADPEGKRPVGQVTAQVGFAPQLGAPVPLPSPDGQKLLYCDRSCDDASTLWLANADGSDARKIISIECCLGPVAWSPNSRRFAYLCLCSGSSAARWELHVVSADGSTDWVVNPSVPPADDTIVWSPDGRHVHLAASKYEPPRSPNGRWRTRYLATGCSGFCPGVKLEIDNARGRLVTVLNGVVLSETWSPNSRLLAYATTDGISVLDPRSGKTRLLSHDVGSRLAWSPDGRLLAYTQGAPYTTPGSLRTVTLHGHVRDVAAEDGPYGGPIFSFAWTRVPNGVSYPAPAPVSGLFTNWPVTALAAAGGRVAYATCAGVFTWDTTAAQAIQLAKTTASIWAASNNCFEPTHEWVSSIALAGDRLAYVDDVAGNTDIWSVVSVSLATTPQPVVLASGSNTVGPPPPRVAGAGELLALASRDLKTFNSTGVPWYIQTIGPSGCPCQEILSFAQPGEPDLYRHLDDVDSGRLVVSGAGLTRILDTDGKLLVTIPLDEPAYAELSGDDLVVQPRNTITVFEGEIRDYSAATGTLLHTWPLAASTQLCPYYCGFSSLQDVARGLAAYTADGQLHLLRLSDGSDTIIGPGNLARFTETGLVVAAGTRIQLIPYAELPLH